MCKRLIEHETLPPLLIRNVIPLCMAQYEKLFSMTRYYRVPCRQPMSQLTMLYCLVLVSSFVVVVVIALLLLLGQLPKVDLIILEGEKCPSVRPSTKSLFDFNEIWYIGRGRWVMHDGMPYGRIQGQGQGHEPLKVWIPSIFKTYLLRHLQWELANDH